MSGYESNTDCTSALSVNGNERAKFPCDFRNGTGRGNIVTWQTLVYLNKMDKVSVKVEEKDVFRSYHTLYYIIETSTVSKNIF